MAIFTLYMYSIRKVIMYNCQLDTQPGHLGPFKGCYSVTFTERFFSQRSKKTLETSKHPVNGGSGIFLFELIGINRGMIEKVGQNLSPKIKQVGVQMNHIFNFEASVTSYVYEIRPKIRGPPGGYSSEFWIGVCREGS